MSDIPTTPPVPEIRKEPRPVADREWAAWRRYALIAAAAGALLCLPGLWLAPVGFFHAYLSAWLFWFGLSFGCLGLMAIHNLTGGQWGLLTRRLTESAAMMLPLLAVLFVPVALGMGRLYPWAHHEPEHHLHPHKQVWLDPAFWLLRAAGYFTIWIVLTLLFWRLSPRPGDTARADRAATLSGPGLVLLVLTVTFAAVDWIMSLEPEFVSSIWGVYFIGGALVSSLAAVILGLLFLSDRPPLRSAATPDRIHDLAKLLGGFVMLWAYFAFSRFLLIWSADLPEEIPFYVHRVTHGWGWVSLSLIALHFALPFFLLLFRRIKKQPQALAAIASLVVAMHFVDMYWLVMPALPEHGIGDVLTAAAATAGVGGLWLAGVLTALPLRPLDASLPTVTPEPSPEAAHA